jgi:hypothetical protein
MAPLLSIIDDADAKTRIIEIIQKFQERLIEERQNTIEGQIVTALNGLLYESTEEVETITPKIISEKMNENGWDISPQVVGRKLKALGFKTKRIGSKGARTLVLDERVLNKCRRRYLGEIVSTSGTDKLTTPTTTIGDNENDKNNGHRPPVSMFAGTSPNELSEMSVLSEKIVVETDTKEDCEQKGDALEHDKTENGEGG